jgi:hypothetical protein
MNLDAVNLLHQWRYDFSPDADVLRIGVPATISLSVGKVAHEKKIHVAFTKGRVALNKGHRRLADPHVP